MKKNLLTVTGFLLFILGFTGLVVNMVGLPFAITDWIYIITGRTIGFLFKIVMIISGIVLVVIANTDDKEDKYDEFFDGKTFD
jgi:hypothetical protein